MKKNLLTAICSFLAACFLFSGCIGPGTQDWRLPLADGYEIWRINSEEIVFGYAEDTSLEVLVDADVTAFFKKDSYIGIRQSSSENEEESELYYLFSLEDKTLSDPLQKADFEALCSDKGIDFTGWTATRPAPDGAVYGN